MNSFLSKSSNLTTDKLYEQKYLKYKSKYLKYIEDNKIQKGGARYKVLVKKINPELGGTLVLEIVLWDSLAPPILKYRPIDENAQYKKGCICFKNYSIDIPDKQIFLTETDYTTLINMYPNIKNMYLEYYTNNNINNSNVIQKAFNRAKRILVETEVLSIEFDIAS